MTNRLMLSAFLVAVSITLVWMFRPEQNAFERLNSTQLRQPASTQAGGEVKLDP